MTIKFLCFKSANNTLAVNCLDELKLCITKFKFAYFCT